MGCGTWGGNSSTLGWRSRCGPLPALPHRGSVGKKSSSMTHNVFRIYMNILDCGDPIFTVKVWSNYDMCLYSLCSSLLPLCAGVSQTSCVRFLRMLGCPSRVSHVFVNTPRVQTVWSPCSDTWRIPMLGCSSSLSSCLERPLSMVG